VPQSLLLEKEGKPAMLPWGALVAPDFALHGELEFAEGIHATAFARRQRFCAIDSFGPDEAQTGELIAYSDPAVAKAKRQARKLDREYAKIDSGQDWNPYIVAELEEELEKATLAIGELNRMKACASPEVLDLAKKLKAIKKIDDRGKRWKRMANRQIACRLFGATFDCSDSDCGARYYRAYACHNRYCPNCGPAIHDALFAKYMRYEPVVNEFLIANSEYPRYTIKWFDITALKDDNPTPGKVKRFKSDVKRLIRRVNKYLASKFALPYSEMLTGYLYCLEFGDYNSNLHCHGILLSPYVEQDWLSKQWASIRKDGSHRVWIKEGDVNLPKGQSAFAAALYHALEYAGKFAAGHDPYRAVALEKAFFGCRRVTALGWFYNRLPAEEKKQVIINCPQCKTGVLARNLNIDWRLVRDLDADGIRNLDVVLQEMGTPEGTARAMAEVYAPPG
jgi:ssDNA-binding Zn-finger/Zn-ribbon topoisomerase 1